MTPGSYTRMQFIRHAVTRTDALQLVQTDSNDDEHVDDTQEPSMSTPQQLDTADTCEVCLLEPRSGWRWFLGAGPLRTLSLLFTMCRRLYRQETAVLSAVFL